jgi:endonuclease-3
MKEDAEVKKKEAALQILAILQKEYPDARVTLDFKNPWQLLIATIMAAQCTDERVNLVTRDLFKKYRRVGDFAAADLSTLEKEIRSTGFFHNKAKSIIGCCQRLVKQFNGEVPRTLEELTSLPGVGRKTANIILGNVYGQQAIAVDTHVKRLSHRLGWAKSDDPDRIEFELMKVVPEDRWTISCHQLVSHGRKVCLARNPQCPSCPVVRFCPKIGVSIKN